MRSSENWPAAGSARVRPEIADDMTGEHVGKPGFANSTCILAMSSKCWAARTTVVADLRRDRSDFKGSTFVPATHPRLAEVEHLAFATLVRRRCAGSSPSV